MSQAEATSQCSPSLCGPACQINGSTLSNYFNDKLGRKGTENMEIRISAWLKDNVAGSLHQLQLRELLSDMKHAVEWNVTEHQVGCAGLRFRFAGKLAEARRARKGVAERGRRRGRSGGLRPLLDARAAASEGLSEVARCNRLW